MDPLTFGAAASLISGVAWALESRRRRRERQALQAVLQSAGIEVEWEGLRVAGRHHVRGRVRGHQRLALAITRKGRSYRVVVSGLEVVRTFGLSSEDVLRPVRRAISGGDIETGDPAFDRTVFVSGSASLALARLDAETRACVSAVFVNGAANFTGRAVLANGRLDVQTIGNPRQSSSVERSLHVIVALAVRLYPPRPLAPALAQHAQQDPLPGVRLANLRVLGREFPDEWATREARVHACTDGDEAVALEGALQLGPNGHDTLRRLVHEASGDDTCLAALAALKDALPAEELLKIFKRARDTRHARTAMACVAALAVLPQAAGLPELVPLLIDDLASAEDGLAETSARALGRLGSIEAVLPLQEAGERAGGTLRAAARQAVAAIQSRAQGASPGQVSLSGGDAGQLSLADSTAGRVSLPED